MTTSKSDIRAGIALIAIGLMVVLIAGGFRATCAVAGGLIVLLLVGVTYFLPAIIASARHHRNEGRAREESSQACQGREEGR